MTKQELKEQLITLYYQYELGKKVVFKNYALSNNPYYIGDIVTDHVASIKIESIGIHVSNGEAECRYEGIQLNKDGKPSKRQDHNIIYQQNIGK